MFGERELNYTNNARRVHRAAERYVAQSNRLASFDGAQQVCAKYRFSTEEWPPAEFQRSIPLQQYASSGSCRQFVLGRVSSLRDYYRDPRFATLDLPNNIWSNNFTYSMAMNDLFLYCAVTSAAHCRTKTKKTFFPLRVVFNQQDLALFVAASRGRNITRTRGERRFNRNGKGWTPNFLKDSNRFAVVLARELCQLSRIFKMTMYQSEEYPTIFFFSFTKSAVPGLTAVSVQ